MGQKRNTRLMAFVFEYGPRRLAKVLDITSVTIRKWNEGKNLPKAFHMYQIKKLSKGKLTPDLMIEEYFKNPANHLKHSIHR